MSICKNKKHSAVKYKFSFCRIVVQSRIVVQIYIKKMRKTSAVAQNDTAVKKKHIVFVLQTDICSKKKRTVFVLQTDI